MNQHDSEVGGVVEDSPSKWELLRNIENGRGIHLGFRRSDQIPGTGLVHFCSFGLFQAGVWAPLEEGPGYKGGLVSRKDLGWGLVPRSFQQTSPLHFLSCAERYSDHG